MGECGRQRVPEEFDWTGRLSLVRDVCVEVVARWRNKAARGEPG